MRDIIDKYMLKKSPNYLPILFTVGEGGTEDDIKKRNEQIQTYLLSPPLPNRLSTCSAISSSGGGGGYVGGLIAEIKELFSKCFQVVENFLYKEPFEHFISDSPHFKRYLQFKHLEKMPITKNTFRMYRGNFFFLRFYLEKNSTAFIIKQNSINF